MRMQGSAGSAVMFAGIHFLLPQARVGVTNIFKAAPQAFYTTQPNGQGQLLQTSRPLLPVIFASFAVVCLSQHFPSPLAVQCVMHVLEGYCVQNGVAHYLQHMQTACEHADNH